MKSTFSAIAAIMGTALCLNSAVAQQPFSNVQQQSTVSPYLNLLNRQSQGLPSYQTLVRPQVEANQQFAKQQNQIQRLQRQQTNLATNGVGGLAIRGVSQKIRGTGQGTHERFMFTDHYFPQRR